MPILKRKKSNNTIYGASDQKVTKFFVFNRAWIANERIVGLTALIVVGLGIIGYATFALSLNSPAGHIDYPAPGQIIGGTGTYIDGWAVAASPVNHVDVVVNGVPARASYGTGAARPDVCAANLYPQSPNCPNVGWQYYFNSTAMPNGTYTLYADIYGSSGGFTETPTQTFTVVNTPPFGYIDSPAPGATVGNTVTPGTTITNVGGWALDNETGISQVTMSIDGIANVYYPIYGASRPDVCAAGAYPNRPNCPNAGFNYSLDTSAIPNGTHTMHITMYDSDGIQKSATMDRTFTVNNTGPPANPTGPGTTPAGGGGGTTPPPAGSLPTGNGLNPDGHVDDPKPNPQAPNPYSGVMTIDGWAVDPQTVVYKVNVVVDGTVAGVASYGTGATRPDVCASHAGWVNCETATTAGNVGWQYKFNTASLTNGNHTVYAVIYDGAYPQRSFNTPTVTFAVKNAVAPPPPATGLPPVSGGIGAVLGYIDSPAANATINSNNYSISGWALDSGTTATPKINSVSLTMDDKLIGSAIYGQPRTDVCAKYSSGACPNVGWNYVYDTTKIANGTHTLIATFTDSTGKYSTFSRIVTVNNASAQPGPTGGAGNGTNGLPSVFVDDPANNSIISSGRVRVDGWAIDNINTIDNAIQSVKVLVDGVYKGTATYGDLRTDVCGFGLNGGGTYVGRLGCPYVGWHYDLDTSGLSNGSHTLSVTTTDTDSTPHSSTYILKIMVNNPVVPPPVLSVAAPAANAQLSGTYTVSGSALSKSSKIASVSFTINGTTYVAKYGLASPGACTSTVTSPDCPNAGFSYALDTTTIKNGPAQMTVVATAQNNTSVSTNINITINNSLPASNSRNTVDRPDDLSGYQVHLIYLVPSDNTAPTGPDTDGTMTESINIAQNWLAAPAQTNGHKLRLDTYQGQPDITYVRTDEPASWYVAQPNFTYVSQEMEDYLLYHGFTDPHKIYLIYADTSIGTGNSLTGQNSVCGVADIRGDDSNGQPDYSKPYFAINFAYAPNDANGPCQSNSLSTNPNFFGEKESNWLHETFHAIGLAPFCDPHISKLSPYHVAGSNIGPDLINPDGTINLNANANDILSPASAAPWILDYNRDDYFIQGNTPAANAQKTNCLPNLNTSPFMTGAPF